MKFPLNKLASIQQIISLESRTTVHVPLERLGSEYGGWWLDTRSLNADSVVYSFGVGDDASFDLALIQRWGMVVHAFDPTPRSLQWVQAQTMPVEFQFHSWGLADYDGVAQFRPPEDEHHVSFTMTNSFSSDSVTGEVCQLSTIMRRLGHTHIDILKMDIEGAEYGVLDVLSRSPVPINQLLIEFHHRFPGVGWRQTATALRKLFTLGFNVAHTSRRGDFLLLSKPYKA